MRGSLTMTPSRLTSPGRRRFGALVLARAGAASLLSARLAHADAPRPAPALSATLLDGRRFTLQQAAGQVLIVNFWATWCAPCRVELPALETYRQRHGARGLQILAISLDEPGKLAAVRDALQGCGFDAALSSQASFEGYGRIWRLPTTFVVDRQGRLHTQLADTAAVLDLTALERHVTPLIGA